VSTIKNGKRPLYFASHPESTKRRDEMAEQKMFANDRRFREGAAMTKRSGRVKMPMIDDISVEWDRRTFLQGLGLAVLAVQSLALIGCESGNPLIDDKKAVDNLIMQSSPGTFDHVHDLLIPYALLRTPPSEGVKLTSTRAFFHRHEIALTQEELTTVNQGGSVTRKASSHLFVIALAK
jgi:hypothetical protein